MIEAALPVAAEVGLLGVGVHAIAAGVQKVARKVKDAVHEIIPI